MSTSLAFVFPGQGSQSLGMLAELGAQYPLILETFKEASAALGYDLWALTQDGPEELLNQTDKTQPAILTASIALWRVWLAEGGARPAFVAGHSLGEYSALVAAGSLTLAEAVKLVERRGQLMQEAVPAGQGGMAAILGLDDAVVIEVCAEAAQGEVVSAVNFNSPGQVVIAGAKAAVERAIEGCKARGAKRALAAAGQRTVPLRTDAPGGRAFCRVRRRHQLAGTADPAGAKRQRRRGTGHWKQLKRDTAGATVQAGALG